MMLVLVRPHFARVREGSGLVWWKRYRGHMRQPAAVSAYERGGIVTDTPT